MFDIYLRSLKDGIFNPICRLVPNFVAPLHITITAFVSGLLSCYFVMQGHIRSSLSFWLINRALDCLDGAVARDRGLASDLGGFLDLLGDFIVYSLIPIACARSNMKSGSKDTLAEMLGADIDVRDWTAVALVEASFHINNFVLFYIAAVLEKRKYMVANLKAGSRDKQRENTRVEELTSVMMKPALIEGMESGVLFTIMLAMPVWTQSLCWIMTFLVGIGICQRVVWLVPVLGR